MVLYHVCAMKHDIQGKQLYFDGIIQADTKTKTYTDYQETKKRVAESMGLSSTEGIIFLSMSVIDEQ